MKEKALYSQQFSIHIAHKPTSELLCVLCVCVGHVNREKASSGSRLLH